MDVYSTIRAAFLRGHEAGIYDAEVRHGIIERWSRSRPTRPDYLARDIEEYIKQERKEAYQAGYLQGQCDIAPNVVDVKLEASKRD